MNRVIVLLAFMVTSYALVAQEKIAPSDSFAVTGLVEKQLIVRYADLAKYPVVSIGAFNVTNHKGELKRSYTNLKGVRLLEVLADLKIASPDPKSLSQFYFVARGSDGYAVVISWNELFNNDIGHSFYLVTEADGESLQSRPERMLLLAAKDLKTGRRFVKSLVSLEVRRI